ncbi:MAG: restriction endonuclease subunit S [Ramlibacter sp.]
MSFRTLSLEDLAAPVKNAIVGGPFGSNLVSKDYTSAGVPVIRGQNMGAKWVSGEFAFVSHDKAASLSQNKARPGDLVFTQRGTLGQVSIVPHQGFEEYIVSQSQMKITPDPTKIDVSYLYYVFRSEEQLQYIRNSAIQTGVPHTNLGILRKTPVVIPSLSVQRHIAGMLNALDDRITLLRETNAALEAIAQALFKSWFVDFDPVHAKQKGLPPAGMDEASAALFPDRFEESKVKPIPLGWRIGVLGDLAHQHRGTINPQQGPHVVFDHFSLPAFDNDRTPVKEPGSKIKSNKTTIPQDAVLLSKLNPHIPRAWLPIGTADNAVCSTEFLVFVAKNGASKEFIYSTFVSPQFKEMLCQLVTGTSNSHQRVKPDGVSAMLTVIPAPQVLALFASEVKPMFERIGQNFLQAQTLAALRDTLLPRLISGQLRIPAETPEMKATP